VDSGRDSEFLATFWRCESPNLAWLSQISPYRVGLRNRRSEVRILSGALQQETAGVRRRPHLQALSVLRTERSRGPGLLRSAAFPRAPRIFPPLIPQRDGAPSAARRLPHAERETALKGRCVAAEYGATGQGVAYRLVIPIPISLDGEPVETETRLTTAGSYVLILSTSVAPRGIDINSVYMGNAIVETQVHHWALAPGRSKAWSETHDPDLLPVRHARGRCLYNHLQALQQCLRRGSTSRLCLADLPPPGS